MLKVESLSVHYGTLCAVSQVSMQVAAGQTLAVLGPNGAGKTSLGRGIVGLEKHRGQVVLDGEDVSTLRPDRRARGGIAYVPSTSRVFSNLTVRENVEVQPTATPGFWDSFTERFPILREKASHPAGSLSGGQQQLLSVARAMATSPRYLVLDEPSAGLAPVVIEQIFDLLKDLPSETVGVVLLEQNAALGVAVADDCVVLSNGEIALKGRADQLSADNTVEKLYLGGVA